MEESGESQISLTDPESCRMQTSQGQQVCYNAQIAVDEKHKLIAIEDVINEVTDLNNLSDIAIGTKEVLETDELDAVADMGYYNGLEVKKCMEQGNDYNKAASLGK